jgi:integrase
MTGWVRGWRKLMEACNMAGFRFHDLRHTFRTMGRDAGVPLETMMLWLGHMDGGLGHLRRRATVVPDSRSHSR